MYSDHLTSTIVIVCWASWLAFWLVTSGWSKPVTERQNTRQRLSYTVLLLAGFVLALSDSRQWPILGRQLLSYSAWLAGLGAVLAVVGVGVTLWARRVLAGNWSADVTFKKDHELVTAGPYTLSRHPIYTGLTLLFVGTALIQGTLASVIAIGLAFISFLIKLAQEERLMTAHFGAAYATYQRRTKRIIPFVL